MAEWARTIAAVWTPLRESPSGPEGKVGTGFWVYKKYFFTAHHVVFDDNRNENEPILIGWGGEPDKPIMHWLEISVNADDIIVYENSDDDILVLKIPQPDGIIGGSRLAPISAKDGAHWSSRGFPIVRRREGLPVSSNYYGRIEPVAPDESTVVLNVECPPSNTDEWGGASGMPIVCEERIIGIVTERMDSFNGKMDAFGGKKITGKLFWSVFEELAIALEIPVDLSDFKQKLKKPISDIEDAAADSHPIRKIFRDCKFDLEEPDKEIEFLMSNRAKDVYIKLHRIKRQIGRLNGHEFQEGSDESSAIEKKTGRVSIPPKSVFVFLERAIAGNTVLRTKRPGADSNSHCIA